MNNEIKELKDEIEDLEWDFADMLKTALFMAGVKDSNLRKAFEAYIETFDEMFDDEDEQLGYRENVKVINHLKNSHPELFN